MRRRKLAEPLWDSTVVLWHDREREALAVNSKIMEMGHIGLMIFCICPSLLSDIHFRERLKYNSEARRYPKIDPCASSSLVPPFVGIGWPSILATSALGSGADESICTQRQNTALSTSSSLGAGSLELLSGGNRPDCHCVSALSEYGLKIKLAVLTVEVCDT
jgi:hypothetical protein